jgi:surfactin synthase thioesterase subunit
MAHVENTAAWWPLAAPADPDDVRLFCLPYAGAGASIYRAWTRETGRATVLPLQLPGREARIREEPFRSMGEAADAIAAILRPWVEKPYALFGASMGALLAFEAARRLERAGPPPRVLFVAAAAAPHRRRVDKPMHLLPDDRFRAALRELEGTPEAVLEHDELMELLLPTLRADFELCEKYLPQSIDIVSIPIVAFGGAADASVPRADLSAWSDVTTAGFRERRFPGGHFFLEANGPEVLADVRAELAVADDAPRPR